MDCRLHIHVHLSGRHRSRSRHRRRDCTRHRTRRRRTSSSSSSSSSPKRTANVLDAFSMGMPPGTWNRPGTWNNPMASSSSSYPVRQEYPINMVPGRFPNSLAAIQDNPPAPVRPSVPLSTQRPTLTSDFSHPDAFSIVQLVQNRIPFPGDTSAIGQYTDMFYEINQAQQWPVERPAPLMGTIPTKPTSSIWVSVPFDQVKTIVLRRKWIEPLYRLVNDVTLENFRVQRDCLFHLLQQNGPITKMNQQTLAVFLNAVIVNRLQIYDFVDHARCFHVNGVNMWFLRTKNFPGPLEEALTGHNYAWCHVCGLDTVLGVLRCGVVLPTTSDGIQLDPNLPLTGFFGRGQQCDGDPWQCATQLAIKCHAHPKNAYGISVGGILRGNHVLPDRSSTWLEEFICTRSGIVKSKSTDRRWCFRCDLASIQFICLTHKADDSSSM